MKMLKGREEVLRRDRERKEKQRRANGGMDMETYLQTQKKRTKSTTDKIRSLIEDNPDISNRQIAKILDISNVTVGKHRRNMDI